MTRPRAYMRWFPADYLVDTVHLSPLEDCLYRRLLDQMWVKGGPLRDEAMMQKVSRFTVEEWAEAWPAVRELLTETAHGWAQSRLMREIAQSEKAYKTAVRAGRKSAEVRRSNRPSKVRSTDPPTNQNQNQNQQLLADARSSSSGEFPMELVSVVGYLNEQAAATWMPGPATTYLHERLSSGATISDCRRAIDEAKARGMRMHPKIIFSESVYPDLIAPKPKPAPKADPDGIVQHRPDEGSPCAECGGKFADLEQHWRDDHPELWGEIQQRREARARTA